VSGDGGIGGGGNGSGESGGGASVARGSRTCPSPPASVASTIDCFPSCRHQSGESGHPLVARFRTHPPRPPSEAHSPSLREVDRRELSFCPLISPRSPIRMYIIPTANCTPVGLRDDRRHHSRVALRERLQRPRRGTHRPHISRLVSGTVSLSRLATPSRLRNICLAASGWKSLIEKAANW
jgi:hypothetical protein